MFNKKRIEELEYQVDSLKRSLDWRSANLNNLADRILNIEYGYKELMSFLKIKEKECKPGLEYHKDA